MLFKNIQINTTLLAIYTCKFKILSKLETVNIADKHKVYDYINLKYYKR